MNFSHAYVADGVHCDYCHLNIAHKRKGEKCPALRKLAAKKIKVVMERVVKVHNRRYSNPVFAANEYMVHYMSANRKLSHKIGYHERYNTVYPRMVKVFTKMLEVA
jgi:hypothetical protein